MCNFYALIQRGMYRMSDKRILLTTSRLKKERKIKRIVKIVLLLVSLLLIALYSAAGIIYNNSSFSITLDKNLYYQRGIIIYDDPDYAVYRSELYAKSPNTFDNISYRWLPKDLNDSPGGTHNGENYLAYTFYIENTGAETASYYSEIVIDDVIKNVDDVVRVRVYKNDTETTYAKMSARGVPENNTVPFLEDRLIALDSNERFKPGDIDKYTVVLWIEGSDPECNDNILGGEIKISMNFNSERINNQEEE